MALRPIFIVSIVYSLVTAIAYAGEITPEMVLGDYQSDPLFGQAQAKQTVAISVEDGHFNPREVIVTHGYNVRFLVSNETDQAHLVVLTKDVSAVLANENYIRSFHDEEQMRRQTAGTHRHQSNSSVEDASPIVRVVSDDPALYLSPGKTKEMLVKIDQVSSVGLYCVLDGHEMTGYSVQLKSE